MRYCARTLKNILCALALLLVMSGTQAGEIEVHNPQLAQNDEGYALSADFQVSLNPRLEEAVNKGVVLYFVTEFELTRSRWWWVDEQAVRRTLEWRLSYHALTRQYRLYRGGLHQSFATLENALRVMSRIRRWPVADKTDIRTEQTYQAGLRMRLDLSQMPKTFQVNALSNRDWTLSSEWARWNFTPAEPPAAQLPQPEATATDAGVGR